MLILHIVGDGGIWWLTGSCHTLRIRIMPLEPIGVATWTRILGALDPEMLYVRRHWIATCFRETSKTWFIFNMFYRWLVQSAKYHFYFSQTKILLTYILRYSDTPCCGTSLCIMHGSQLKCRNSCVTRHKGFGEFIPADEDYALTWKVERWYTQV